MGFLAHSTNRFPMCEAQANVPFAANFRGVRWKSSLSFFVWLARSKGISPPRFYALLAILFLPGVLVWAGTFLNITSIMPERALGTGKPPPHIQPVTRINMTLRTPVLHR